MKGLETGKEKIQKICDALKKETLEPAKQEAREVVENAHLQAAEILAQAKKKAEEMQATQEKQMEERQKIFQASLQLACKQGIEQLKQTIERELFNQQLTELIAKEMREPKVIAHLINSLMRSLEEKGIEEDFVAVIPKEITPRSISSLLATQILAKLENRVAALGDFAGGVQIGLKGRQITIDISDTAVRELIARYIRRDFRDLIFQV